jgi:hypothetical protein
MCIASHEIALRIEELDDSLNRIRSYPNSSSHDRACPGNPLLPWSAVGSRTWMPATSAGMTPSGCFDPIEIRSKFHDEARD